MPLNINQMEAKIHLSSWKVGALFMEAGTGKTRVACEIINSIQGIDGVFWVAPLSTIKKSEAKENIPDEVVKWGGIYAHTSYVGIESIQSSDRIFLNLIENIERCNKPFVVVDESLKIKNPEAKRTKRILELSKLVEYKLILNGTPLSKNLLDLWSQMEFLSPKILGMTFRQFKNTFCEYTKIIKYLGRIRREKEFITGYENIDYLYSLIRHYVYECDLKLNITQNYNTIIYHLNDDEKLEYNRLKLLFLEDETLAWKNNNIFLEMTNKMQHSYCCAEDKFNKLDELFNKIDPKKTIIFCKYVDSREECERRYSDSRVLSYQKGSFGLNLQNYCYTVYFDKIWDLALRIQSGRRTFRTGQEYNCYYWDLTGDVGLERMIDKNIDKKVSMTEYFKSKTKEKIVEEL